MTTFLAILNAIPVVGNIVKLLTTGVGKCVYGVKYLIWSLRLKKIEDKKKEVMDEQTPEELSQSIDDIISRL